MTNKQKKLELQRTAVKVNCMNSGGLEHIRGFIGCIIKMKAKHGGQQLTQVSSTSAGVFTMTCNQILSALAAWIQTSNSKQAEKIVRDSMPQVVKDVIDGKRAR